MRLIRLLLVFAIALFGLYALSMLWTEENEEYVFESEIPYPIEKVYPQFNNLQRFASWNRFFKESPTMQIQYFRPYEGKGASLSYKDTKTKEKGEFFLRYENPNSTIRYQLLQGKDSRPFLIDIKFVPSNPTHTRLLWKIQSPKKAFLERSANWFSDNDFVSSLQNSLSALNQSLGSKVDREILLSSITYDSLMVVEEEGGLLLGTSVNSSNRGDDLLENLELNHGKVYNFLTADMKKEEDEIGFPIRITDAQSYKTKETSYYYGFPVKSRSSLSDNNFTFRTQNPSRKYVIYYEGSFSGRKGAIESLLKKARTDSMRYGSLEETYFSAPRKEQDIHVKLSLPVYR